MTRWRLPLALVMGLALAACSGGGTGGLGGGGNNGGVASITITPADATIRVGSTQDFTAVAKDANGNTLPSASITWQSSDTAVASIEPNGTAKGLTLGSTSITAKSGSISSSPAKLTVAAPVTANAFLSVVGKTANGNGGIWYGGGDVKLYPVSPYSSVSFTASGIGSGFSGTATASGYTISAATFNGTYPNVQVTATSATNNGTPVIPSGAGANLGLKIDNEAPGAAFAAGNNYGNDVNGKCDFPFDPTRAITPGSSVTWNFTAWDAGVGVNRVDTLANVERANRLTDAKIGEAYFVVADPGTLNKTFPVQSTVNSSITFTAHGHQKTYDLQPVDALGNRMAIDPSFKSLAYQAQTCNGYFNDLSYTYPAEPANYKDPKNRHTIPEVDSVAVSGTTVTATGVYGSAHGNPVVNYAWNGDNAVTEVRFYRRHRNTTGDWTKDEPFQYIGSVKNPTGTTVSLTDPSLANYNPAAEEVAAIIYNERGSVGMAILDYSACYTCNPPAGTPPSSGNGG